MKNHHCASAKPVVFILILLMTVCHFHIGLEKDNNAMVLQAFVSAKGSAVSTAEPSQQDAALQKQYDAAQAFFDAQDYKSALEGFDALGDFSDSRARASDSRKKWKAASYKEAEALFEAEQYNEAKAIFETLGEYKNSQSYIYKCNMAILRAQYLQAKDLFAAGDYENAKQMFDALGKFRDSAEWAQDADDGIKAQEKAKAEQASYEAALALKSAGDLDGARDALIEAGDYGDATDQLYDIIDTLALRKTYEQAENDFANEDFESAYNLFTALKDYESSVAKAALAKAAWQAAQYQQAAALQSSDPNRAYILFLSLGDYQDSAAAANQLKAATTEQRVYDAADVLELEGSYTQAKYGFEAVSAFSDSGERIAQAAENVRQMKEYQQAKFLSAIGDVEQANGIFTALGDFNGASKQLAPVTRFSTKQLRDDRTSDLSPVFTAPDGTKHRYRIYKGVRTWVEAKAFCEALGGHLATLTTAEENEFVHNFMLDSGYLTAYFGLSDEERTGDWVWVTGEPFVYSNWNKGQPSRSGRERYGMYFYKHTKGTWNDSHFYETVKVDPGCSFICEWDE